MPIYEYLCEHCGSAHEFIQKISEPPKTDCPHCGQASLKKCISRSSFQLKGTGWYVTDFRDNTSSPSAKKDKSDKSE
jgi:putative FmdB family regulatory protein